MDTYLTGHRICQRGPGPGILAISEGERPPTHSTRKLMTTATQTTQETYNGWTNYETWNAALWIGNDEFLYNTAKACVEFCDDTETPWAKFVRCMTEGQIGRHLVTTGDGVRWDDEAINEEEMLEMMTEL